MTQLATDILLDGFDRVEEGVRAVLEELTPQDLVWRPAPGANPVGWLVWHLVRQQDAQLAQVGGHDEVWSTGWRARFDLPYAADEMGYGQAPEQVGRFRLEDPALLTGYAAAVHTQTLQLLEGLGESDYGRVVDESYDPPVTVAVRLVSVLEDALKHLGQAEYLAGLLDRRRP